MRKKTFAPPTPRSKRALALALSAALLAAGTAGAVTLSGYDLYVKDDTAKGGAALRSDTAITRTDIDGLTSNVVHTDKAPYEAKGGAIYSDASV